MQPVCVKGQLYLVKADQVELTAHVDPLGTNAKDADAPQAPLRVHDAGRHGCRQGRRHGDGDDVQRFNDDGVSRDLEEHTEEE